MSAAHCRGLSGGTGGTGGYTPPSGGYSSGKAIGIGVGAAAGAAVGIALLVRHHHHHSAEKTETYVTGCTQSIQGGINLTDEKDNQTYSIVTNSKSLKAGERIRLKGVLVATDGPGNPTFQMRSVIKDYQLFWLGESYSPLPNFDYYNPKERSWRFEWKEWAHAIESGRATDGKKPSLAADNGFDKKDLIILKELQLDGRVTLAALSKLLGMTLPATKYRFDRLVEQGYVGDFVISILPFIPEVSDLWELRLDFTNESFMKNAEKMLSKTPFVLTMTPIMGLHSLAVRIYLPRQEMTNLMTFLSSLAREEILAGYSYLQLDPSTQLTQTISYKTYADGTGWHYDNREYLQSVANLVSKWSRLEAEQASQQTSIPLTVE